MIGETLAAKRGERGLTIDQVAASTRVRREHLRALEAEDFTHFSAPVYAKGSLRTYATYLGLDADDLIRRMPADSGKLHLALGLEKRDRARPAVTFLEAQRQVEFPGVGRHAPDKIVGVQAEIGRVGAEVAFGVDGRRKVREVLRFERSEMLSPDPGRGGNLVDREATLAALCGESLTNHSRPNRSSRSSTSGRFINTSRDFEPW